VAAERHHLAQQLEVERLTLAPGELGLDLTGQRAALSQRDLGRPDIRPFVCESICAALSPSA